MKPLGPPRGGYPPVLLFDGVCNLCNAWVQWVIARDRSGRFRFASLQSEAADRVLEGKVFAEALPDSVVLVDSAGVHMRSDAVLRVAKHLGFPYSLLAVALLVPRALRDFVYAFIARNRYRWFGRRDACAIPTPELASRFLDAEETLPREDPDA